MGSSDKRDAMQRAADRWLKAPTPTRAGPPLFSGLRSIDLRWRLQMDLIHLLIAVLRRLGCHVEAYTHPASGRGSTRLRVETGPEGLIRLSVAESGSGRPAEHRA